MFLNANGPAVLQGASLTIKCDDGHEHKTDQDNGRLYLEDISRWPRPNLHLHVTTSERDAMIRGLGGTPPLRARVSKFARSGPESRWWLATCSRCGMLRLEETMQDAITIGRRHLERHEAVRW